MDKSKLYENIPQKDLPVHFVLYSQMGEHPFSAHWHEHLEIHYIMEGTTSVWCEGEITEAKAGECIVINSNELHESVCGESKYFCIIIPPSVREDNNVIYNKVINDTCVRDIAEKLLYEYTHYDKVSDIAITGYTNLLIAELKRKHIYKEFNSVGYSAYSRKTAMLNKVVKYLEDNYCEEINLEDISGFVNINMFYLCNIFREYTGKTVKEYINGLRIAKAKELLIGTDIPITEVGFMCGFNDSNYFSRKFKQITGETPRNTRKQALV